MTLLKEGQSRNIDESATERSWHRIMVSPTRYNFETWTTASHRFAQHRQQRPHGPQNEALERSDMSFNISFPPRSIFGLFLIS
jgi:hypothetical protein